MALVVFDEAYFWWLYLRQFGTRVLFSKFALIIDVIGLIRRVLPLLIIFGRKLGGQAANVTRHCKWRHIHVFEGLIYCSGRISLAFLRPLLRVIFSLIFHFDEQAIKLFHLLNTLLILLQLLWVALLLFGFRRMERWLLCCMDFVDGVGIYVVVDAGRIEFLQSISNLLFLCELEEVFKSVPLLVTLINYLRVLHILFHAFVNLPMLFQHLAKVWLLVRPNCAVGVLSILRASLRNIVTGLNFGWFWS